MKVGVVLTIIGMASMDSANQVIPIVITLLGMAITGIALKRGYKV